MKVRLQKILAQSTSLSRRAAEKAIEQGLVKVNNVVITKLGSCADPDKDKITFAGERVRPLRQKIYVLYNKPRNTIVSKNDPEGRPTIWDRLSPEMKDVLNAAGRLDFESEGLLILTNDGELINQLTHPKGELWKTYHVRIGGVPKEADLEKLRRGVSLDDGKTLPAKVKLLRSTEDGNSVVEICIMEGKNRQIRRMFSKIGHEVRKLKRVAIGDNKLGNIRTGEWRYANKEEYLAIKKLVNG